MFVALPIHLLSAVIWIGGMFFAYMALRPVAASLLKPPQRLPLWTGTFGRFFPWVWAAVILLPLSGYWMAYTLYREMASFPLYVHVMQIIGIAMILLYLHVFFSPYRRMKQALREGELKEAGRQLGRIRRVIGINLVLGLLLLVIVAAGRYL